MSEWDRYWRARPSLGEFLIVNAFFFVVILVLVGVPVGAAVAILRRLG